MSSLIEFLREQSQRPTQDLSPEEIRQDWLDSLEGLFITFSEQLQQPEDDGLVIISNDPPISRDEEYIGKYEVSRLVLTFPGFRTSILIEPIARLVVGGMGRVDLRSTRGSFKLLRHGDGQYYYDPEQRREKFLDQPLFEDLIRRSD